MVWENLLKKEPKQGPQMGDKLFEEKYAKNLEDMIENLSDTVVQFRRNADFLRSLIGNKEAEEVLDGIGIALRTYGENLQFVAGSTDYSKGFRGRELNVKNREYLEKRGQEMIDLAKEIMQL